MKNLSKKLISLVLTTAMIVGMTGCTTYTNFKNAFFSDGPAATERTVKIGVFEPTSGKNKTEGKEEVMGIELAHEIYPSVVGKQVELVYGDNQSDMYVGDTVIQEMISASQPTLVLGSYGETLTLVASKYTKKAGIPAITISSTNPLITANNNYYFSATYTETMQGDALANFAVNMKKDSAATVKVENDDTTAATIKRFTNRMKKLTENNQSVVGNFTLSTQNTDYTDVIEQIRDSGARTVFLSVSAKTAKEFLTQATDNNLTHVLFLGTREWNDEDFLKFVRENGKLNVAYPTEQSQNAETALSKTFLAAYKEKYGEDAEPSERTAVAFDAYMVAITAIENAMNTVNETDAQTLQESAATEAEGKAAVQEWKKARAEGIPTGRQIKEALNKIEGFQGASGVINYDGNNEATKSITIDYIANGRDMPAYIVE